MVRRSVISALAILAATCVAATPALAQHRYYDQRDDQDGRGGHDRHDRDGRGFQDHRNDTPYNDRQQQQPQQQQERAPQREVPLSSVLRELKDRYGGQHLDAQKVGNRYIISWVTGDGKRLTIEVDAASGRILSIR